MEVIEVADILKDLDKKIHKVKAERKKGAKLKKALNLG